MSDVECLQCGETRAVVKANGLFCVIMGGGEHPEPLEDWPRHRWADWSDKELSRMGLLPEFFDKYRRANVRDFEFIPCPHFGRPHSPRDCDYLPKTWCGACFTDLAKESK